MEILVTGGRGFLGRQVIKILLDRGLSPSFLTRNADISQQIYGAVPLIGDLMSITSNNIKRFDAVIHLAGLKPGAFRDDDYEYINVMGTKHLVEISEKASIRRFIHISTMAVSADRDDYYAASKREAERIVQESTLDWTIIRPGAIYGVNDWWISYLNLMKKKKIVTVVGDGEQYLHQIYVKDCAHAIVMTLLNATTKYKIYYAASAPITYNYYLSILRNSLQANFMVVYIPRWIGRSYAALMKYVFRSPKPEYSDDPHKDLAIGSAHRIKGRVRTLDSVLAEILSKVIS